VKILRTVLVTLVLAVLVAPLGPDSAAAQKDKGKDTKAAVFEVYKDKGGKFRFRFYDNDGEEVAMSVRGYEQKADCVKAIEALKKEAAKAKITEDKK